MISANSLLNIASRDPWQLMNLRRTVERRSGFDQVRLADSQRPQTSSIAVWAAWYANLGVRVLPLSGKVPRISKIDGGKGVHDATTDGDLIREWWTRWPAANIGVALDGMAIIDVDANRCGHDTFDALVAAHYLAAGPCVLTGGGGMHWYFRAAEHIKSGTDRFGPGVDCKTDASSYAIVPPSVHPSGPAYRWLPNYGPERALPAIPASLIEEIAPQKRTPAGRRTETCPRSGGLSDATTLRRLADEVALAPPGGRHDALYKAAARAGDLVRKGRLDAVITYDALHAAATLAYGSDADLHHVGRTIRDGILKATRA